MAKRISYEQRKAFVLAFLRLAYEPIAFELVSKGIEKNERTSAAVARAGMRMAVADLLEDSAGYPQAMVIELDRKLKESGAPTLTEMRALSLGFVKKLRNKSKIRSEDEYLVIRAIVETGLISNGELIADLQRRLTDYEGVDGRSDAPLFGTKFA